MFWVEGWIEIARSPDTADEHAWFGVVRLLSIVDVWDADTERLFGLSKRYLRGECEDEALAADRGVPPNPSSQVRQELEQIAAHEAKYGPGEFGGYTHALWIEIRGYELVEREIEPQLRVAFDLARVLEQRYGPECVRFVVWFNW
jgi:hypothetical protein